MGWICCKRVLIVSATLFFCYANAYAASEDEAWQTLQKAAEASRSLSYQGIFLYQTDKVSRSVQVTHMNYGQGEYARMLVLDGRPREVLSQGNNVVVFNQKSEKVVIEKRRGQHMFPALIPSDISQLKANYSIRTNGIDRVAGREGIGLALDPKDKFRYGYRLWTDKQHGLLLKIVSTNERNEAMEQMAFNQLMMLSTQNMEWFQPNVDHKKPYVMEENTVAEVTGELEWVIGNLPAGYQKVEQVQRQVPGKPFPVTHLIYSDGLASISVFIEKIAKGQAVKNGLVSTGATNLFARNNGDHQIVAVGEVPATAVLEFANAVSFIKSTKESAPIPAP